MGHLIGRDNIRCYRFQLDNFNESQMLLIEVLTHVVIISFPLRILQKLAAREFESQKRSDEMSLAEVEEQSVRKRRAEGTPCNSKNFEIWREAFSKEMAEKDAEEEAAKLESAKKQKEKKEDKSGRITGFLHFSGKAGKNLEDMEKAAEEAEGAPIDPDELDVDEDLFDLEDDEDLDSLDFEDDEDDEPDI